MSKQVRFDSNNYEFNKQSKNGVYLIHGFTNTTYEVKVLAEYLADKGYYTVAENLPGHGTTVEECNRVKYTDRIDATKEGLATLASKCDKVHIIGISMGAVIALHLATMFPINSLTIAAPVFKFRSQFKVHVLVPLFNKLIQLTDKGSQYPNPEEMNFYGYKHYPNIALNEFRKMTHIVRKNLSQIKTPTLMLFSKSDATCIIDNYDILNTELHSNVKESLILDKVSHVMLDDTQYIDEHKLIYSTINQFLDRF